MALTVNLQVNLPEGMDQALFNSFTPAPQIWARRQVNQ